MPYFFQNFYINNEYMCVHMSMHICFIYIHNSIQKKNKNLSTLYVRFNLTQYKSNDQDN